jgi:hypothetical protein
VTLLESIPTESLQTDLFRLAPHQHAAEFLRSEGYEDQAVDEMLELLKSRGVSEGTEDLLDGPFRPKPQLQKARHRTRFSDSSFPVFYASLEPETVEAEVKYWFLKNVAGPAKPRTAYYSRLSAQFEGSIKDLRPALPGWPELTHDSDYSFCNRLGNEARSLGLDGLVAPSARKRNGTNLPVFARRALSNPVVHAVVAMTLDRSSGEVLLRETV